MKGNTQELVNFFENIISVCSAVNIENVIIEDGMIRGINEDKSCVILSSSNLPDFGSSKLGLARMSVLAARINVLKNSKDFTIEAEVNSKTDEITHLRLTGGGAKVQFRCAAPSIIRAPKAVNDAPCWRLEVSKEQAEMIISAVRVMGAKTVVVAKKGAAAIVECSDTNNDVFSIKLETAPEWVNEESSDPAPAFAYYYPANILLSLLKQKQGCEFIIGENGTLTTQINGHFLTVISKVD